MTDSKGGNWEGGQGVGKQSRIWICKNSQKQLSYLVYRVFSSEQNIYLFKLIRTLVKFSNIYLLNVKAHETLFTL